MSFNKQKSLTESMMVKDIKPLDHDKVNILLILIIFRYSEQKTS